jgi:parallel beta-helix repeat protein
LEVPLPSLARSFLSAAILALGGVGISAGVASAATLDVCASGCTYSTIGAAVAAANANDTISVGPGTYGENVTLDKAGLTLQSTGGPAGTIVSAPVGSTAPAIKLAASGVTVNGLTITRDGNDPTQWNDTLSLGGVTVQGQAITGTTVENSFITGNRTGIDVNNSNGHTITGNTITNNRTGLIFRNQTDNLSVTNNAITNNWTVGVLFLAATTPLQQALNSHFNDNSISGNWYGQVADRQPGAGTNVKDFSGNWYGTNNPVVTTADSAEPGYAAQIPVAFGGTATPPGNQPDIAGPGSANVDYTPFLWTGANAAFIGFQGDFSQLGVTADGAQSGTTGRIQEAIDLAPANGTVHVLAGTYADGANVNKAGLKLLGAQNGQDARSRSDSESVVTAQLKIAADDLTFDGFTFQDIPAAAIYGSTHQGTQILNNVFRNNMFGAQYDNHAAGGASPSLVRQNLFDANNNGVNGGTGLFIHGTGSENLTVTENEFRGQVNAAGNFGQASNLAFTNNTAVGESSLVVLQSSSGATIAGNSATGTVGSGIYLANSNNGVDISGNDLDSAGGASAVRVSDAFGVGANQNVTVTGNTIRGAWTYAINANAGTLSGHLVAWQNRFSVGINNADADPANSINAAGNWWGCNGGPGTSGCASNSAGVTAASWLQLRLAASATVIPTGTGTSALTASLVDSGSGAVASLFPVTPVGFGTSLGSVPSSAPMSAGVAAATLSAGPQAGTADATATLDNATARVSVTLVYYGPPTPPAPPTPPTPPAPPVVTDQPSQNPVGPDQGSSKPTPQEVKETTQDAKSTLGVPVKHDTAFDLGGDALVYVPRRRSDEAPAVRGHTATFKRSAIKDGDSQDLLAVGCPAVDCTVDFTLKITYRDADGKLKTIELPADSVDVSSGKVAALSLDLPESVRKALLKGTKVKLSIGITVTDQDGTKLGSDSRTLTLKTPQPKKHKHHNRHKH